MAAERNVSLLVEHSWVVPMVHCVRILPTAVWSDIMSLAGGADISIYNNLAINGNFDAITFHADLFGAPLAKRLVDNPLPSECGHRHRC